jgi:hypothetical protein
MMPETPENVSSNALPELPMGALASAVAGHYVTVEEKLLGVLRALDADFTPVMDWMASATCAIDEDDLPAAA